MKKINNKETKALIKSLLFTILLSTFMILLVGCDEKKTSLENAKIADPFCVIKGYEIDGLVYMKSTLTIYILFSEPTNYGGYGYLAPYIQNGHFCEYRDGEIVEVIPANSSINESITELSPDEIWNNLSDEEKQELIKYK